MNFTNIFFGRNQNSNNSRKTDQKLNKRSAVRSRSLSLEALESRDLLSVTTDLIDVSDEAEYLASAEVAPAIQAENLSADLSDSDLSTPTALNAETPAGYNDHDYQAMVAFLEQTDLAGVKNGTRLNSNYDPTKPSTWSGIGWTTVNGQKYIGSFYVYDNFLSGFANFSDMIYLSTINCYSNQLTSLDVSGCTALKKLECIDNILTSLDVSGCTSLTELRCYGNQLNSLSVSDCTMLTRLQCQGNQLTTLNMSGCTALTYLDCSSNQLVTLNMSGCTALTYLSCSSNLLTSLNLSSFPALTGLYCYKNPITQLDVSRCTNLVTFQCLVNDKLQNVFLSNNAIGKINISSNTGGNWVISNSQGSKNVRMYDGYTPEELPFTATYGSQTVTFSAFSVPAGYNESDYLAMRTFLEQEDSENVKNGTKIITSYSVDDPTTWTGVTWEIVNNEKRVASIRWDSLSLVGYADFSSMTSLQNLSIYNNQLIQLNVYGCNALTSLNCSSNQLTNLVISGCTTLTTLYCDSNQLSTLALSTSIALIDINCDSNKLASLDVSFNTKLQTLKCDSNQIVDLDLSSNTELTTLSCSSNALTWLYVTRNSALTTLNCNSNQLSKLDLSGNANLTALNCYSNNLKTLDVSQNILLKLLCCWCENLTAVTLQSEAIGQTAVNLYYGSESSWTITDATGKTTILPAEYNATYTPSVLPFTATNEAGTQTIAFNQYFITLEAPTLNTVSVEQATVTAKWSAVENASGYTLEYQVSGSSDWQKVTGIEGTTGSFNGIAGNTYNVRVKANGTGLYSDSAYSNTQSVKILVALTTPAIQKVNVEGQKVSVSWSYIPNATSYRFEYQPQGSETWTSISSKTTSASFTGNIGITYNLRVKAVGGGNYSDSDYAYETATIANTLEAVNDFVKTNIGQPITVDYRSNDKVVDWSITGVQFGTASHGEMTVNDNGTITYTPTAGFYGTDVIAYALLSSSGKIALAGISIDVQLPIITSVQKSDTPHMPQTAMAESVTRMTDWEKSYVELWAENTNQLNTGSTTVTLTYNPNLYMAPDFSSMADGVEFTVSQSVELPDGNVELELTANVTQTQASETDNLYLGTLQLTPYTNIKAGVDDELVPESVCSLNGAELSTEVLSMPYDLQRNGIVDSNDFILFATVYGMKPGTMSESDPYYKEVCMADYDKNGKVDSNDFLAFATNYGLKKTNYPDVMLPEVKESSELRVASCESEESCENVSEERSEKREARSENVTTVNVTDEAESNGRNENVLSANGAGESESVRIQNNNLMVADGTENVSSLNIKVADGTSPLCMDVALLDLYENQYPSDEASNTTTLQRGDNSTLFVEPDTEDASPVTSEIIDAVLDELFEIEF